MSEKKDRDDVERANELLSLLRKYWKIEDDSGDRDKITMPDPKGSAVAYGSPQEDMISEETSEEKAEDDNVISDSEPFVLDNPEPDIDNENAEGEAEAETEAEAEAEPEDDGSSDEDIDEEPEDDGSSDEDIDEETDDDDEFSDEDADEEPDDDEFSDEETDEEPDDDDEFSDEETDEEPEDDGSSDEETDEEPEDDGSSDEDIDEEPDEEDDTFFGEDIDGEPEVTEEKPIVTKPIERVADPRFKGLFGARREIPDVDADGADTAEKKDAPEPISEAPWEIEKAPEPIEPEPAPFKPFDIMTDDIGDEDEDDVDDGYGEGYDDGEPAADDQPQDEPEADDALLEPEEPTDSVDDGEDSEDSEDSEEQTAIGEPAFAHALPVVEMDAEVGSDADDDLEYDYVDDLAEETAQPTEVQETADAEQLELEGICSDSEEQAEADAPEKASAIANEREATVAEGKTDEDAVATEEAPADEAPAEQSTEPIKEKMEPFPDMLPDEAFFEECARLELPRLSMRARPFADDDPDGALDAVGSGYAYAEPEPEPELDLPPELAEADREAAVEAYYSERYAEKRAKQRAAVASAGRGVLYCFILACVTLLFEGLGYLFGGNMLSGSYGHVIFAFDIALTLLCAFVARELYSELFAALRGRYAVPAECVGCVPCLAVLAYDIAAAAVLRGGLSELRLIGSCASASTLVCLTVRYIRLRQDMRTLEAVSRPGERATLLELEGDSSLPEYREFEGMLRETAPIFCVNELEKLTSVCSDAHKRGKKSRYLPIFLLICALCSLGGGAFAYIRLGSVYGGVLSMFSVLLAALPCGFSAASVALRGGMLSRAAACGATVTDDGMPAHLKNGVAVLLRDTELFPADGVDVVSYNVVSDACESAEGGTAPKRAQSHAMSLLRTLGGTLSGIASTVGADIRLCDDVVLTDISEKGVSALVEGACVRVGSAAYLGRHGVSVTPDTAERAACERTLYISDNGVFFAKAVLSFKADKLLCKRIRKLRESGVAVSLKTCDPCIDAELVLATAALEPELVKVIRYKVADSLAPSPNRREGAISSSSGVGGLFSALGACFRAVRSAKLSRVMCAVLSALGAVGAVACASVAPGSSAVLIGAYQLICGAVCAAVSRLR